MENKFINFVWIYIGSESDQYIGERKKYCLIEYSINEDNEFSLKLSSFITKSFPWKPIDELNYADTKTVNKMINNNRRFLYKVDNDKYGYICNIFDGKYIFNNEENKNIKDKLQELAYNTGLVCL